MRLKSSTPIFVVLLCAWLGASAEPPKVSFSGYLDADVLTDFEGNFFTNQELDLGMSLAFGEKVSANVYATVLAGAIPAGTGRPAERWAALLFDGFDITFETGIGTFSVGDLVYQYGGFNYYFYKRLSMITPESFTRGLSYSFEAGALKQTILLGAADDADELLSYRVQTVEADTIEVNGDSIVDFGNSADVVGKSELAITEGHSVSLFYGLRMDVAKPFDAENARVFGGLEYLGSFGEVLELKADFGYQNYGGEASTFSLLVEPLLTFGDFSIAASYYQFFDPDDTGRNFIGDEMYVYVEPGYAFSEMIALGLPLEVHEEESDDDTMEFVDKSSFWAVPTLYIYPADGVEWWLWGQVAVPFSGDDPIYAVGSEIIVEF
ncbi:MAG: hypothetical protein GF331_11405 [Chitinivibrionales bacterium]|nr:hypothetical protein [Chitinivibrionales bacterium]